MPIRLNQTKIILTYVSYIHHHHHRLKHTALRKVRNMKTRIPLLYAKL